MLHCYIYLFNVKCKILFHLAFNVKCKMLFHLTFNVKCKMDVYLISHNYMICVIMIGSYIKKFVLTVFMANGL